MTDNVRNAFEIILKEMTFYFMMTLSKELKERL